MKLFENLNIRTKLLASFGIVIAFSISIAVLGIFTINNIGKNYRYLMEMPIHRADLMQGIDTKFMTMRYRAANFAMNTTDPDFINETLLPQYNAAYDFMMNNIAAYITSVNQDTTMPEADKTDRIQTINALKALLAEYKKQSDVTYDYSIKGDAVKADQTLKDVIPLSGEITTAIYDSVEATNAYTASVDAQVAATQKSALIFLIVLSIIIILLSMALALMIASMISRPIKRLLDATDKISQGQLSVNKVPAARDEVGVLVDNFFKVVDVFRSLIDDMSNMAQEHHIGNTKAALQEDKYDGDYREMASLANRMVKEHIDEKELAMTCVSKIVGGDFSADIPQLPGDKQMMNQTIEDLRKSLSGIANEVDGMIQNCLAGELTNQIDVSRYQGDWIELMNGLNSVLAAVNAPIQESEAVLRQLSNGDFSLRMNGSYEGSFRSMQNSLNETIDSISSYIKEISAILLDMSNGDMRKHIQRTYVGDFSEIKDSINAIVDKLSQTLSEIITASDQILSGAQQISSSSMTLAEGATTQSSAIQELSASVDLINQQTQDNAQNSHDANELSQKSNENAISGNEEMKKMLDSMDGIKASSNNISNVIKVIEDIAFQTNLLALNAAVEAARAGEHGKGFAVVADEVRNLAARSQNAAHETTDMIEDSIARVNGGTQIAKATAESLNTIVSNASEVSEIITHISASSREQALAVQEISSGLSQIAQVTVTNSSTSEESAAAAQQLNSQAEVLRQMVSFFKI